MSYLLMVSVLASVDGGQLTSGVEKPGPVLSWSRELSCEHTKVKTYFTHQMKSDLKINISLSVLYMNNVFRVFTLLSEALSFGTTFSQPYNFCIPPHMLIFSAAHWNPLIQKYPEVVLSWQQ